MVERRSDSWRARNIAFVVFAVAALYGDVLYLMSLLEPSGQVLTVAKPTGGTLTGPGIQCGTQGSDCVVRRPTGDSFELVAYAVSGFVLTAFTGDCAPHGVVALTSAKTCGAIFENLNIVGMSVMAETLTVSPVPQGGTLEGVRILCGTKGSVCSTRHAHGQTVELHPTTDPGFTFMGF